MPRVDQLAKSAGVLALTEHSLGYRAMSTLLWAIGEGEENAGQGGRDDEIGRGMAYLAWFMLSIVHTSLRFHSL